MPEFKNKEEYEKWKAEKNNAVKSKTNDIASTTNKSEQTESTAKPKITQNLPKKGKSKKALFIIVYILSVVLSVVVLAGAVTAYFIYFRQTNFTGLWTGKSELTDFIKTIDKKELADEDKLPVDVSLVLKHEDNKVISGKLTFRNFVYSDIDVPIDINGKIEGSGLKFQGEANMATVRIKVDLLDAEVKNNTIDANLGVFLNWHDAGGHRMFRGRIKLERY